MSESDETFITRASSYPLWVPLVAGAVAIFGTTAVIARYNDPRLYLALGLTISLVAGGYAVVAYLRQN